MAKLSRPPGLPPLTRVGHKGADRLERGNTPESFEAALRVGVDMIEFDVLPLRDGRLVLAHDHEDAAEGEPLTLAEGLDLLSGEAFAGVELNVDLKLPGYEREVLEGLEARGLSGRALISSTFPQSLARIGELAPGVPRGWSIPRASRDYTRTVWALPAYGYMRYLRARLPRRAGAALRAGRCEVLAAHWLLASAALVRAVHRAGGRLFVWTVDDRARIQRLAALGVDGVISNDPRLFGPHPAR